MKIWKYTKLDSILFGLTVFQFVMTCFVAFHWHSFSETERVLSFLGLLFMMGYSIIVIAHLFTHTPWFESRMLNMIASMIKSVNIGQSVHIYQLMHVRNHHKYNNDMQDENGETQDLSSTFRDGKNQGHDSILHYAFYGAFNSFIDFFASFIKHLLLPSLRFQSYQFPKTIVLKEEDKHQIKLDTFFRLIMVIIFLSLSWQFFLFCYLPAVYLSLAFVNIQNYYEHFGANPESKFANSVSYYGRLYNFLTFNDGYHQEHHLRYGLHWTKMPEVLKQYQKELSETKRIISPYPAILGFLDFGREQLHKTTSSLKSSSTIASEEKGVL